MGENEAWRDLTPATLVGEHNACRVYQIDSQVYVFETAGHLTSDLMYRCFRSCWDAPNFHEPYGVVTMIIGDTTYDPDLRHFSDRPDLISSAAVGLVTEKTLRRMILSTIGIATRLKHGTELSAHADFPAALSAVRKVLQKRA